MKPIPLKLREEIAKDPFMKRCIYEHIGKGHECRGRIEWEHAFIYQTQINEAWAIVPVCTYHHRGDGLDKDYNRYCAIIRADIDDIMRSMPKTNWRQIKKYLCEKYKGIKIKRFDEGLDVITPPRL